LPQGIQQAAGAAAIPQGTDNGQVVLEMDNRPTVIVYGQGNCGQMGKNAAQGVVIESLRGLSLV
jgi:hypothetical protein